MWNITESSQHTHTHHYNNDKICGTITCLKKTLFHCSCFLLMAAVYSQQNINSISIHIKIILCIFIIQLQKYTSNQHPSTLHLKGARNTKNYVSDTAKKSSKNWTMCMLTRWLRTPAGSSSSPITLSAISPTYEYKCTYCTPVCYAIHR